MHIIYTQINSNVKSAESEYLSPSPFLPLPFSLPFSPLSDVAGYYLEELECPSHLSSLLSALPRVADLVVRLKPKLISDPLLSPTSGTPYTYMRVCRLTKL